MVLYAMAIASLASIVTSLSAPGSLIRATVPNIGVDWNTVLIESKTTTTLQVVVNPLLLPDSPIRDQAMVSLNSVAADYVRFVPWFPYPKLSVPEVDAPVNVGTDSCTTSWNFTYSDPMVDDFFKATANVSHIINFSTTPDWMWVIDSPYSYPEDINVTDFAYNNGTALRDPSMKEVSDYYARLVSWYVNGGFTDECGVYHESRHNYTIEYWEVFNEIEAEHAIQPAFYNQLYDSIVTAIHAVSPDTKFVGLALATRNTTYVESFLDPTLHAANIPLDFFSYHWYGSPTENTTENEAAQCWAQADVFLGEVAEIEAIRLRLSPSTKTTLDEIGTFDPLSTTVINPGYTVPDIYFVWSGAIYAYVFSHVVALGIDVIGESQLVGYPGQYPSVSMVNYTTGTPNARLRVLQLIQQSFKAGDSVVQTNSSSEDVVHAQGFRSPAGVQKMLLVNKLEEATTVNLCGFEGGSAETVDLSTAGDVWRTETVIGCTVGVTGYATVVLTALPAKH